MDGEKSDSVQVWQGLDRVEKKKQDGDTKQLRSVGLFREGERSQTWRRMPMDRDWHITKAAKAAPTEREERGEEKDFGSQRESDKRKKERKKGKKTIYVIYSILRFPFFCFMFL